MINVICALFTFPHGPVTQYNITNNFTIEYALKIIESTSVVAIILVDYDGKLYISKE